MTTNKKPYCKIKNILLIIPDYIFIQTNMEEIFYTKDNYWFSVENDVATVGITNFLLDEMDMINFVELPTIGNICSKTELIGQINYNSDEKLDLFSIFNGKIVDINDSLIDNCEQLFGNDIENSWLYRINVDSKSELEEEAMTKDQYDEYLEEVK